MRSHTEGTTTTWCAGMLLGFLLAGCWWDAEAALAVRQTKAGTRVSATQIQVTFDSAVLAGSLLIAHGAVFNNGGNGEPTISDNINGTWGAAATTGYATSGDTDSELWLWSFPNSGAGTITVTMNPPGTASDNDLTLLEVTGAATTSPRDITVTATGATPTPTVTTGTLAQAAEIVMFSFSHTGSNTTLTTDTGDGFTQVAENESNSTGQTFNVAYKITAATTSIVANGTLGADNSWFAGVASFKEAAAGAPATRPRVLVY